MIAKYYQSSLEIRRNFIVIEWFVAVRLAPAADSSTKPTILIVPLFYPEGE